MLTLSSESPNPQPGQKLLHLKCDLSVHVASWESALALKPASLLGFVLFVPGSFRLHLSVTSPCSKGHAGVPGPQLGTVAPQLPRSEGLGQVSGHTV